MIRESATSTDFRKQKILDLLKQLRPNQSATVQQFGLQLSDKFTEVKARIMDPPKLQYGNNKVITPAQGVWRGENLPFLQPVNATQITWGVLNLDGRTQRSAIEQFCQMVSFTNRHINFSY